ncbi:MAG TPA: hypothetical protein VGP05_21355 [Pseudonocardia sp.]|jgi:hypothetical protein|nr:hypothetical protein [Pseudonocardia sp.]
MTGSFGLDGMASSLVRIRETLHLDDLVRITAWPPTDSDGGDPE